jgi:hypothetical protein
MSAAVRVVGMVAVAVVALAASSLAPALSPAHAAEKPLKLLAELLSVFSWGPSHT